MTAALFGIPADASVAFAEPKNAKRIDGAALAKTVARRATEEERWRYGVELRITGSRWRPQTRAPHYAVPEPYVYRKRTHSLAWTPYQLGGISQATKYEAWLAARDKAAAQPEARHDDQPSAGEQAGTRTDKRRVEGRGATNQRGSAGRNGESRPVAAPTAAALTNNVVPLRAPESAHAHVREVPTLAGRKAEAAELLREIAGQYGPRRAHKLRAIADWLTATENTKRENRNA